MISFTLKRAFSRPGIKPHKPPASIPAIIMTGIKTQAGVVAGKTGTPERIVKGESINDGWYVFFAPEVKGEGHLVVCIRIEGAKGSSDAVRLAGKHIVPLLLERNYIKSFDPLKKAEGSMASNNGMN